ncbi:MAG: BON domain-containing protein [Proteobacteria bacterium]|nr:BON domain-containing protein [Pseudomonadota bacterium]
MSDDTQLQQRVMAELNWQPGVTAGHIGVTAKAGIVTLSGHVESYADKHAAEAITRRVRGVFGVAEDIVVELPVHIKRTDEDIAAAAVERLAWDVSVPRDSVKVTVADGWLTLTGRVGAHYQREAATRDVQGLIGVRGVSSEITIKPRVDATNLSQDIMHALQRSWFVEPNAISVTVEGGAVRLTGTVHSPHERNLAATTAWSAPGTITVENNITVS